ncbi:F-box/LRR-repeat protein 25-like protein [Tanacetum coccineum]
MAEEEDRISSLPDCLLLEIISRIKVNEKYYERTLTTKEVIRTTSTISKRWQHLWTQCPNLTFLEWYDLNSEDRYDDADHTDYFSFISNTLTQCPIHVKLNKFEVDISYNSWVDSNTRGFPHINSWIRYAITRNVQEVVLQLYDLNVHDYELVWYDDELFFNNSCITSMIVSDCLFNPPNGAIRWDKLKCLSISGGKLDEDIIENILSGSPVLESLVLHNCYGFERIDVTSTSVKNLEFSTYDYHAVTIKINAPYILSLTIKDALDLKKLLLLNVSSLVKAELSDDYEKPREDIEDEELLKGLLHSLVHVKHIKLGYSYLEVLSRLKAKGFQFFRVRADGDEDRIPELFASAAAETKTEEKVEETGESDDDMGLMSLFD